MRTSEIFKASVGGSTASRTRRLVQYLLDQMGDKGKEEPAAALVQAFVESFTKVDKDGRTDILLFLGDDELTRMAAVLSEKWKELSELKAKDREKVAKDLGAKYQLATRSADVALFGRMLASKERKDMNISAACQVAHALSTHTTDLEFDYFTAIDDLQPDDETGAGQIGVVEYQSACFYRYLYLDLDQLKENLGNDGTQTLKTVEAFLHAANAAIPTGKQNSFAAQCLPSLAYGVVRAGGLPLSLVNAFERPVRAERDGGFDGPSRVALERHWNALWTAYGDNTTLKAQPYLLPAGDDMQFDSRGQRAANLNELVSTVVKACEGIR